MNPTDQRALPFDHFQRYETAARLIRTVLGEGEGRILEIGPDECLYLSHLFPAAGVSYLDLRVPPHLAGRAGYIQGDACESGLPTGSYDVVVALDVFEHIPAERRRLFLEEMLRISRKAVVLCAPFRSDEIEGAEKRTDSCHHLIFGKQNHYLLEHAQYGLPDLEEYRRMVENLGSPARVFGHGNVRLWESLMRMRFLAGRHPFLEAHFAAINRHYNCCLYEKDLAPPAYRLFTFMAKAAGGAGLPDLSRIFPDQGAKAAAISEGELAAFHGMEQGFFNVAGICLSDIRSAENDNFFRRTVSETARIFRERLDMTEARISGLNKPIEELIGDYRRLKDAETQREKDAARLAVESARRESESARREILVLAQEVNRLAQLADSLRLTRRLQKNLRRARRILAWSAGLSGRFWRAYREHGLKGCCRKIARKLESGAVLPGIISPAGPTAFAAYDTYVTRNTVTPRLAALMASAAKKFRNRPLVSILMPVYNVEPVWLRQAVDSVLGQVYTDWELCIADDASTKPETVAILKSYAGAGDRRIKVVFREKNGNICEATNTAAKSATGEFVAFMDNDDMLAPNALFEIVRHLQCHPDTDVLYSDEDKIDEENRRHDPQFKPDWSPELFLSYNYVNHFTCMRRSLFEAVGGFRRGFEGAQDYDLLLRAFEKSDRVAHLPKVLYHWRAIRGSTALNAGDKPQMLLSARKGLQERLARTKCRAAIYHPYFAESRNLPIFQLDWPDSGPEVAIIIPTRNQGGYLRKCIGTIVSKTRYSSYRIMVIDNDSDDPETLKYLEEMRGKGVAVERIGNEGAPFSFSRINNLAAARVQSEILLFLNNDMEIVSPQWLSRMTGFLGLPGVGAVGAKLLFPDQRLQHAGVVLGMHGGMVPDHAFIGKPAEVVSYYHLADVARNCAAVTGACLMTRRADFLALGGFDEKAFPVSLQDVDFCLRLGQKGLRTVYAAGAELLHHTSASRDLEDDPSELAEFRARHGALADPFYNPNLSSELSFHPGNRSALADCFALSPAPLRIALFTHSLEMSGAPKAMLDLAAGLRESSPGRLEIEVVSPEDGPMGGAFEAAGARRRIMGVGTKNIAAGWLSREDYEAGLRETGTFLASARPDVVITNTIFGFYAVKAAAAAGIPAIWIISESLQPGELRRALNDFAFDDCVRAFSQAYAVVFGSNGARACYQSHQRADNFHVIKNSVDLAGIRAYMERTGKDEARRLIKAPEDKIVFLMVGTICDRKDQKTIAEAFAILPAEVKSRIFCFLVGANEHLAGDYLRRLRTFIDERGLSGVINIVGETRELYRYYRAADVFLFSSTSECYPLATLEAMAFGLPIVTTPCCGVTEQVRSINARFFSGGDAPALAERVASLAADRTAMESMGRNSRHISAYMQSLPEMLDKYWELVSGAWATGGAGRSYEA